MNLQKHRIPHLLISIPWLQHAPSVGKYSVDIASFERLALPELQLQPGVQLYVVDEVGREGGEMLWRYLGRHFGFG